MNDYAKGMLFERDACLRIVQAEPAFPGPIPWRLRLMVLVAPARALRAAAEAMRAAIFREIHGRGL